MDIPRRPTTLEYVLKEHAEKDCPVPTFVYRFPDPAEEVELLQRQVSTMKVDDDVADQLAELPTQEAQAERLAELMREGKVRPNSAWARGLCQIFDEFIVGVRLLTIGGEPFDREKHLDQIPGRWKVEVAREISQRSDSYLSEGELGN